MATRKKSTSTRKTTASAESTSPVGSYEHKTAGALIRPEVGVQPRFKKRKPPAIYSYDPSLAPTMQWDGQNPAREQGEALIARIDAAAQRLAAAVAAQDGQAAQDAQAELNAAAAQLKALSRPFLEWSGKAERLSFEVPTLPLFIHERLSTQAILESLKGFKANSQMAFDFGGHPDRDLAEQLLKAYEYPNGWFNRMILGDSLVVMNSLLQYEHMAGQVQMIYMDPPYGVKFGSNFQPFVRKRDVTHGADEDLTREPEMVKAYRDTWELGLHSYLTYLRDRLLLARELLTDSGSVFVQISDENLHHVREVMDEVFGAENAAGVITIQKTSSQSTKGVQSVADYLLLYAKDKARQKLNPLLRLKAPGERGAKQYTSIISPDRTQYRRMTADELSGITSIPEGWEVCALGPLTSQGEQPERSKSYVFNGVSFPCPANRHWSYDPSTGAEMDKLAAMGRIRISGKSIRSVLLASDNPTTQLDNVWLDTGTGSFTEEQLYVVQTSEKVIARAVLMTTDPGDLVLDPTCGSGTTAYVAEQWGRRWITIDTSRVPLALARQRLLTATFDYPELKDPASGPAGGFIYKMKQNKKGEHVGGIVPHVTLKSIANGEAPEVEVLVDRPEIMPGITRVTGPFVFEATIPTAQGFDGADTAEGEALPDAAAPGAPQDESEDTFITRMVSVLQASPVLHLPGNQQLTLAQVRRPARALWLSAEAERPAEGQTEKTEPVAIVFGPAHGSVTRRLVEEAWGEAQLPGRGYKHLYVIGFAIEPDARQRIEDYYPKLGLPVTYVQATPDVLMGDLLKNMRSSQIFSVCGQPEIELTQVETPKDGAPNAQYWQCKLLGLDVFDPANDRVEATPGKEVPAWFLDTDYNGLVFRPRQAFFPLTGAWDSLKRALRAEFDDSVWAHLAGDTSEPFMSGPNCQIAVKVIDQRGNELMVVRELKAEAARKTGKKN